MPILVNFKRDGLELSLIQLSECPIRQPRSLTYFQIPKTVKILPLVLPRRSSSLRVWTEIKFYTWYLLIHPRSRWELTIWVGIYGPNLKTFKFFPPLNSWPWPKFHASTIITEILVMPLDIDDQFQKHSLNWLIGGPLNASQNGRLMAQPYHLYRNNFMS